MDLYKEMSDTGGWAEYVPYKQLTFLVEFVVLYLFIFYYKYIYFFIYIYNRYVLCLLRGVCLSLWHVAMRKRLQSYKTTCKNNTFMIN